MGFAGRGNEKDRQLGMGMGFAVRTEWEWQNTEWGSLPLTVLRGSVGGMREVSSKGGGEQRKACQRGWFFLGPKANMTL